MPYTNLMIDIETTGTKPGCGILTIAAVPFTSHKVTATSACFYEKISPSSNTEVMLDQAPDTMRWWERQPAHIREEAFSGTLHISEVLARLGSYISSIPSLVGIWGNGATFDVPILEAAYAACSLQPPWTYKQARCYRTLNALAPSWIMPQAMAPEAKHCALNDAIFQAERAANILKWMERK